MCAAMTSTMMMKKLFGKDFFDKQKFNGIARNMNLCTNLFKKKQNPHL